MTDDSEPQVLSHVEIGPPAHGGHCVARVDGRVVFVRHTAPGEVVDVRLTDAGQGRRFWRGEAVTVHEASPDRVPSVWPQAGPGGVGGGELGHLALAAQRRWKADVLRDVLTRIGHLDVAALGELSVLPLGEDDAAHGLATRTRIDLVLDEDRRAGMFRHRSHEVLALSEMPLADPAIAELDLFAAGRWTGLPPGTRIDVVAPSAGPAIAIAAGELLRPDGSPPLPVPAAAAGSEGDPHAGSVPRGRHRGRRPRAARAKDTRRAPRAGGAPDAGVSVQESVPHGAGALSYTVGAQGFWQVHRHAPQTLVAAVLAGLRPGAGDRVVDLYSGAGLFAQPLALAVGGTGRVDAVEVDPGAARHARRNLRALPQAEVHSAPVTAETLHRLGADAPRVDGIVLDPPRSGAGKGVMAELAGLRPGRIVYVACDPAALARDLAALVGHGYRLVSLQGYDLFPHTHHFECVAVLEPIP